LLLQKRSDPAEENAQEFGKHRLALCIVSTHLTHHGGLDLHSMCSAVSA
jgi:hypothetical protein